MTSSEKGLIIKLSADVEDLKKSMRKASNDIDNFSKGVKKIGGVIATAFSVREVGAFVLQVSKLAGQAEGVSAAFNRLPNSIQLMNQLKQATGGTVSELELMKRSVMASNFDISLKALPQLLEFATVRARQTGQSVDYLVDSIVTGIGRKSKLILDNLGISAVQLTEALGGASAASASIGEVADAVGKIAAENLKKMGSLTDDAAVKTDRLAAEWENLKVQLGQAANSSGLPKLMQFFSEFANLLSVSMGGRTNNPIEELNVALNLINANLDSNMLPQWLEEAQKLAKAAGTEIVKLGNGVYALNEKAGPNNQKGDNVFALFNDATKTQKAVKNIAFFEEQIKSLNEEIKLAGSQSQIKKFQKEIKDAELEIDKLLGKLNFVGAKSVAIKPINKPDAPDAKSITQMISAMGYEAESIDKKFSSVEEARKKIEHFGISTKKGLEQAGKALREFTQGGDAEKFNDSIRTIAHNEDKMLTFAGKFGDELGQSIGDLITGAKTLAQAFSEMAVSVLESLQKVVLARMVANSAKFGPVGIAAAMLGFGAAKSIFRSIGSGGTSTRVTTSSSLGNAALDRDLRAAGMNVTFEIEGTKLKGVLSNTDRAYSRTKTT